MLFQSPALSNNWVDVELTPFPIHSLLATPRLLGCGKYAHFAAVSLLLLSRYLTRPKATDHPTVYTLFAPPHLKGVNFLIFDSICGDLPI